MRTIKLQYRRSAVMLLCLLLTFMVVGSFLDLSISKLFYPGHENSVGQFFAAFGELPAFTALSCAGCLLLVFRARINEAWSGLIALMGGGLILMALVLSVHEATDSVPAMPVWVALLVNVFVMAACGVGIVYYARTAPVKTVVRFVLTLIVVAIGTMVLIHIVKVPWGRARMRLIVQTGNESYFAPWWQAGTALKKQLVAEGVSSDEFRSFPSGHTACASCAMLLALLPTLSRARRKKTGTLFAVGCAWTLVVAFTRIWMGAHFLTDVTMAWLITLAVSALSVYLFYFNKRFFDTVWQFITQLPNPFTHQRHADAPQEEEEY